MRKHLFILFQLAFGILSRAQFVNFSEGNAAEMKNLDNLHKELAAAKTNTLQADILNSLARVFYHLNDNDSLGYYSKRALDLSQNVHYAKGEFVAHIWMIEWLNRIGN